MNTDSGIVYQLDHIWSCNFLLPCGWYLGSFYLYRMSAIKSDRCLLRNFTKVFPGYDFHLSIWPFVHFVPKTLWRRDELMLDSAWWRISLWGGSTWNNMLLLVVSAWVVKMHLLVFQLQSHRAKHKLSFIMGFTALKSQHLSMAAFHLTVFKNMYKCVSMKVSLSLCKWLNE